MIRQDITAKRRTAIHHGKKQFATPEWKQVEYKHRLNFYSTPPTADITLEQFEQWAIDRLRGLFFSLPLLYYPSPNPNPTLQSFPTSTPKSLKDPKKKE
jgi:hypothetical protein